MRGAGVRMVVMSVTVMAVTVMPVGVIHLVAARIAPMGTIKRDRAREQRADQWQENDGLNHCPVSPSSD
jgi:heme exporter protein D